MMMASPFCIIPPIRRLSTIAPACSMGTSLDDARCSGIDTGWTIRITSDAPAGERLTPSTRCQIAAILLVEMETIAAQHVTHLLPGILDSQSGGDDAADGDLGQLLGNGEHDAAEHMLLVVPVKSERFVLTVSGVGPSHVPYHGHLLVGTSSCHIVFERVQM